MSDKRFGGASNAVGRVGSPHFLSVITEIVFDSLQRSALSASMSYQRSRSYERTNQAAASVRPHEFERHALLVRQIASSMLTVEGAGVSCGHCRTCR
jgi:hypothetical protein